ncbi:hypothetical protein PV08_06585 [Exophiala spinifera]|uniref:NADH:flavin oxidoreductase/NADH oxidase N-terminal domain-containing protein n=1 Tax=Exophiala spinifera TaxID=91928 RepID=A0A0D2BD70_9EURO|nr:uncharacterized protein PV08_06585 [Exophiala spinifera]KIW16530.1 hypothetical protein PV08_06585 [Exophiala spinifera]
MAEVVRLVASANARGPTSGFTDADDDAVQLPLDYDRQGSKIFLPLRVGAFTLQHRIVHAALGRSRSIYGQESPLAVKYFEQRATPGGLIISQATGGKPEWSAWPFSASIHSESQIKAVRQITEAVHKKGGIWFQQLTHVGRCTSPALVKLAWERAGHSKPPDYGYKAFAPSAIGESGVCTHSGEPFGVPHSVSLEQIKEIREDFQNSARNAVRAGADGIEILSGNGFLLDQFLHDNINQRTDQYGGSVENRSRFTLEIVDDIAQIVGHQKIGVRLSPFSNFHETDGSQPLAQILHLARELALRGVAYIHVGEARVSRNLGIEENLQRLAHKGIPPEDISLRPFHKLLQETRPTNPSDAPTVLFGAGGYTSATAILTVDGDLADAVVFGRRFISNPDLVNRLRLGVPLTPYDRDTFYTHGSKGYITYKTYSEGNIDEDVDSTTNDTSYGTTSSVNGHHKPKTVAIIGAGVSGIVSASAFQRLGDEFEIHVFERKSDPGGSWAYDPISNVIPIFPASDPDVINPPLPRPKAKLPVTTARNKQQRFTSSPLYESLYANIPYNVMSENSSIKLPNPKLESAPYCSADQISEAVVTAALRFEKLIRYNTTVEAVEKIENKRLRLTLRTENPNDTDTWYEEEFDFLIVATGHNSVPHVPAIPGLNTWKGQLSHTTTWRSGKDFSGKRILVVGSNESAIDVTLQSLPYVQWPIYVSQRTPHPRFPTVFTRKGVEVLPTIECIEGGTIHFSGGQALTSIDTIVFATGYFYTYPFLKHVRPSVPGGQRVPGLYQHVFDMYNPNIAFIGVANGSLSWLTWEKSAFLSALLWSGRIKLPPIEEQKKWEARRLAETTSKEKMFHILAKPSERVIYFDELNELAADYLHTDAPDDELLRSFPWDWIVSLGTGAARKAQYYGVEV